MADTRTINKAERSREIAAQYEELAKAPGSSLASEAQARLADLPPSTVSRQVDVPLTAPTGAGTNQP